ncbi:HNH endonuclease [Alphaproteobacteria bacterium]|nr:HNH endonuclease [Alphaproteobacteria bacterium]
MTQLVNIANGRVAFINKNKELYNKKVKRLSEFKVQPSNMFFRQPDTDKVTKLKKDIKIYKDQQKFLTDLTLEIAKCQKHLHVLVISRVKFFTKERFPNISKISKNVTPNIKDDTIIEQTKIDMWKAKAAAFDGEKRRGQGEIKLSLKSQLVNYPRCPYCESELIYENCHVDHIYPANRGGLTISDNMVLICSPCNLSKSADSLRSFAKRNHLNYDKIITRLEVMGKHI